MFSSNTSQVSNAAPYIEDVFSTYLYTGTGATQTITNGIDLSTYGGLVWMKRRSTAANHQLYDTARGATKKLASNETTAEATETLGLTAFNSTGFTLGSDSNANGNGSTYASWTFRKQPKFFDVVTYTGTGSAQAINHNLGSVPGFIIVKATSTTSFWAAYHQSLGATKGFDFNTSDPAYTSAGYWSNTAPTSTQFTVGTAASTNSSGQTYVAYLFAHDAGGFGLTGTDNVISCGSFTQPSSGNATITLGYEPQWVLIKRTDSTSLWFMYDIMRGMSLTNDAELAANTSGAEGLLGGGYIYPTSTGFVSVNGNLSAGTYIYIAIRRGPMKTPTSGTSVFTPVQNSNFTAGVVIAGQPTVDVSWSKQKDAVNAMRIFDRLRGSTTSTNYTLVPSSTAAESNEAYWAMDQQNGVRITQTLGTFNYINYFFSRAPGFFDIVNNASGSPMPHNLGVTPELIITRVRNYSPQDWFVFAPAVLGLGPGVNGTLSLNLTNAAYATNYVSAATATTITTTLGSSTYPYIFYLFASCPGVSKVTNFTGTGSLQTINCGFTSGARWVLVKRTDAAGDWYVWDSARGISSSNDPYLLLNSTAAEVTTTNWVDTTSTGFQVTAAAGNNVNINGASYIALAIA